VSRFSFRIGKTAHHSEKNIVSVPPFTVCILGDSAGDGHPRCGEFTLSEVHQLAAPRIWNQCIHRQVPGGHRGRERRYSTRYLRLLGAGRVNQLWTIRCQCTSGIELRESCFTRLADWTNAGKIPRQVAPRVALIAACQRGR